MHEFKNSFEMGLFSNWIGKQFVLIGLRLKYEDHFDKYWFVLYFSPKFETDPKRMGINDIVKLWGRTISFIEMIKCCTFRYTFAQFTQRQAKSILYIFFLLWLDFIRPENLSYQPKKNKTMRCILFHYIAVENVQIKKLYRQNEMTFSHLAHFWKPIYFWIHSIWFRIKSVMCNTYQCIILWEIVISVSIFCDANESVAINQHNLFEYYVNYIGNLPFFRWTVLCSSHTLDQFRWMNRLKIPMNVLNSTLMWVRNSHLIFVYSFQHFSVVPVILRIVYFSLTFSSFLLDSAYIRNVWWFDV